MKKNYDQLTMFDNCLETDSNSKNNNYEELQIEYTYNLPTDWETKLKSYNINQYVNDIENHGLTTTWDYICKYVLNMIITVSFLMYLILENYMKLLLLLKIKN